MRTKITILILLIIIFALPGPAISSAQSNNSSTYVVQAGFYRQQTILDHNLAKLRQQGFPVYKSAAGDGYRLYVGDFTSREQAAATATRLEGMGFETLIKAQPKTTSPQPVPPSVPQPKVGPPDKLTKNIFLPQDVTIKGIFGGHNIFFFVAEHWEPTDGCYIKLVLSQSEIKQYKNSTLTLLLNDLPVKSIPLIDKANYKVEEAIPLPPEHITPGYNLITFSTYHRISDDSCSDDLNPANWLVFHRESHVHLEYKEIVPELGIQNYPYPYLKTAADEPVNCIIALPDNPSSGQMTAAIIIATDFGRRVPYDNIDLKVKTYSEIKNSTEENLIIVGSPANAGHPLLAEVKDELTGLSDRALIKEVSAAKSPPSRRLYLVAQNDEALVRAAKALTSDQLVSQLEGTSQYVDQSFYIANSGGKQPQNLITLKDLGYDDTLLEGIMFQQATFGIRIPRNHRLKEDSFIQLPLRYCKALDFNKSSVSAYLNNIPVTNKLLQQELADGDNLTVNIPNEFWDEDYLELKIVFYLEPAGFDCTNWRYGNIWALISNEAGFNIPQEKIKDNYLQHYPGLLMKENTLDDLLIILPAPVKSTYLSMAANIMAFIGHSLDTVDNVDVITSPAFDRTDKGRNLIVIGTPQDNGVIKLIGEHLHLGFDESWSKFLPNRKIAIVPECSDNLASIQLLASPFKQQQHLLVITGTAGESLTAAERYLKDLALYTELEGDTAVIDKDGYLQTAYFIPPQEPSLKKAIAAQQLSAKWQHNPQLIMYTAFFALVLLIGIYGLIVITKRK